MLAHLPRPAVDIQLVEVVVLDQPRLPVATLCKLWCLLNLAKFHILYIKLMMVALPRLTIDNFCCKRFGANSNSPCHMTRL